MNIFLHLKLSDHYFMLLLMMMIPEDQQSYIRSMSLRTQRNPKSTEDYEQDPVWKAPGMQEYDLVWPVCSTFWADLKTLRIIRESRTSDMSTKEASKNCLVASVAVN
ncbi:hypothetical protein AVEN_5028-1 [Araneus ventricosus]|uniref:Uncharacterized protein n=1 Tax=Araneus ventricosus TaxID=182803 RepID=A0A4Y2JP75_ARAVE|nr:hypothetical protein AVEN_5028-1 [Araneus ventricosus]